MNSGVILEDGIDVLGKCKESKTMINQPRV
jgi:hypothetical protein